MNTMEMYPRRRRAAATGAALAILLIALAAAAQETPPPSGGTAAEPTSPTDPISALRAEIAGLKQDYEAKIAGLEARLAALEAAQGREGRGGSPPAPETSPADEAAALRAAALQAAGASTPAPTAGAPSGGGEPADLRAAARAAAGQVAAVPAPATVTPAPTAGRGRNLSQLNPEISFTGDFVAVAGSGARDEFDAREFELDLQSTLDPFSRTRLTLAFGSEGDVDVEEGYVTYNALPGGIALDLGRFRQQFGALNRQHLHALPQSDYPLALRTFFGDEALAQTGVSARWLLPHPWADANELTVEFTDGENEAFGGESFHDFSGLLHLKNYWDLSAAAYFEWGLSGVAGKTADGRGRRIWGTDLTFHWQPPQRAKYRELTWRTEVLLSDLGGGSEAADGGPSMDTGGQAWGGYTYLEGLVARNLYVGARLDRVEDPFAPGRRTWGIVPYVTWWQSEFVRARAEYRHLVDEATDRTDDGVLLQLTWAAGPHKHESY